MPAQLSLSLEQAPSYARASFVVSASNASALRTLETWPDWRGGALVLAGPKGCGKTHLAHLWADRVGAKVLSETSMEAFDGLHGPALLEDADGRLADEPLFHLLNLAARHRHALLLTSRLPPSLWPASLPDLRSRLNALPAALLLEPDEEVLTAMLAKALRERNVRPTAELLAYLVRRIERSAQSAQAIAAKLDEAAYSRGCGVSRGLARLVLGEDVDLPAAE